MIAAESKLRIKDDARILLWGTGDSISLNYYLFCTVNHKLCLCVSRKINPAEKKLERIDWFHNHRICVLRIDDIGYFAYILTSTGYLIRLPLGIFGQKQAQDTWNVAVANAQNQQPTEGQSRQHLIPPAELLSWQQQQQKLKEITIINFMSITPMHNIISFPAQKPVQPTKSQLVEFVDAIVWSANDRKEYLIVASQHGLIFFFSFETGNVHFGVNFSSESAQTIRDVKLVETKSISYLIVGLNDENVQITLQQNKYSSTQENSQKSRISNMSNGSSSSLSSSTKSGSGSTNSNQEDPKNLMNNSKSMLSSDSIVVLPNRTGYSSFVSEEAGVIRIFFYHRRKHILKVYRPASQRSKYSYMLPTEGEVVQITQWKNYYLIWTESEQDGTKVQFYLKTSLQKLSDITPITASDGSSSSSCVRVVHHRPIFSHEIYSHRTKVIVVGEPMMLSEKKFTMEVLKSSGIDMVHIDLNKGKRVLEEQIRSDSFEMTTYKFYETFLKNHAYDVIEEKQVLYESLKSLNKWQNMCLIDLEENSADPFTLFHQYSAALHTPAMEQLLFRSLLNAFDKVEILEEETMAEFMACIILGFFRVKEKNCFDSTARFKSMGEILQEQSRNESEWIHILQKQQSSRVHSQFLQFLGEGIGADSQDSDSSSKRLIDFSEYNEIFKSKRHAELVFNLISVSIAMIQTSSAASGEVEHASLLDYADDFSRSGQISRSGKPDRINSQNLSQVVVTRSHWLSEAFLRFELASTNQLPDCHVYLKSLLLIMLHSSRDGFLNEFSYYLQELKTNELLNLLEVATVKMRMFYADTPFLRSGCLSLLLTQFEGNVVHAESIEELFKVALLPMSAKQNLKPKRSLKELLEKIVRQRAKISSGIHQKYISGIDAVWMILSTTIQRIAENVENEKINNREKNFNLDDNCLVEGQYLDQIPGSNNFNMERILPLDILEECDQEVRPEMSAGIETTSNIGSTDSSKEIQEFLKQQLKQSPQQRNQTILSIPDYPGINKFDPDLVQFANDVLLSLQKMTSNKVKKGVIPVYQLNILISSLS